MIYSQEKSKIIVVVRDLKFETHKGFWFSCTKEVFNFFLREIVIYKFTKLYLNRNWNLRDKVALFC